MRFNFSMEIGDAVLSEALKLANEREIKAIPELNIHDVINWIFDHQKQMDEEEKGMIIDILTPKENTSEQENIYP